MQETPRSHARAMQDLMFEALKRKDRTLNQLATEALAGIGSLVVHTLVLEILASKEPGYRARLLHVIAEIGEITEPSDHLALFYLTRDKDSRIRRAAVSALYTVGPRNRRTLARLEQIAQRGDHLDQT